MGPKLARHGHWFYIAFEHRAGPVSVRTMAVRKGVYLDHSLTGTNSLPGGKSQISASVRQGRNKEL